MSNWKKNFFRISIFDRIKLLSQYYLENIHKIAPPQLITFRLVSRDSSSFLYTGCDGFYGFRGNKPYAYQKNFPLSSFRRLADYAFASGSTFFFWGEDIGKNEDFYSYLEYLSLKNIPCRIMTLAGVDEGIMPYIRKGNIKEVIFSFETYPLQKHINIYPALKDLYQKAFNAINLIKDFQQHNPSVKIELSASIIISESNSYFLEEMLSWSKMRELDCLYLFHANTIVPSHASYHLGKFYDLFQISATSWRDRVVECNAIEPSVLIPQIRVIQRNALRQPHVFIPDLKPWQINPYYTDYNFASGHERCYAPWFIMNVFENGDVVSCANYPDYQLGNIVDNDIESLWNGELIGRFRSELMLLDRLPLCTRCSCLYA